MITQHPSTKKCLVGYHSNPFLAKHLQLIFTAESTFDINILLQALKTRSTRIQKSCLTNLHLNTHIYIYINTHMYMPIYIYIHVYIYIYILSLSLYVINTRYCLCQCAPSMQWLNISTPTAFARCAWHLRSQHGALQALLTSLLHLGGDRGCIPLSEWVMGYTQI